MNLEPTVKQGCLSVLAAPSCFGFLAVLAVLIGGGALIDLAGR
ncbi:hypothetical protein ACIP98_36360 [Streptomyces sp. NPDC088354]